MAISETTLKDTMLMLIEQQNAKAGFWAAARSRRGRSGLGLAAVCRKGARTSDRGEVDVIFGCWTSVSRKAVCR
jgi:urea transport system substrate-binding protein